jgi:hypothetical protein
MRKPEGWSCRRPECSGLFGDPSVRHGSWPFVAGPARPAPVHLIVTAKINDVISIARVAKMLDEDEAWLERLAKEIRSEDGGLRLRPPPYSNAASIGRRKPSANRLV